MNEQKNNGRGIFYGVIGVATLVVAIIGATFAYFTATQTAGNNVITGNMATISFGLKVEKIVDPGITSGMIPMSNDMIEAAVNNDKNATCVDDNGNAVCQIYKITVTNTSSAAMFVDGYVALAGGSGTPTDYPAAYYSDASRFVVKPYAQGTAEDGVKNITTMRWAQVFPDADDYSTGGTQVLGKGTGTSGADSSVTYPAIGETKGSGTANGKNSANIKTDNVRSDVTISGSNYSALNTNYIRLSEHAMITPTTAGVPGTIDGSFDRTDVTSMLVLSQNLKANTATDGSNIATYYIMVWLSETGTSQNKTSATSTDPNLTASESEFFNGLVTFNSAQGSEVTATFSGYTAVPSDKAELPK